MSILRRAGHYLIQMVGLAALAAQCALGQMGAPAPQSAGAGAQLPVFEVASIRPSKADNGFLNFMIAPNRFRVENGTAISLIRFAYHIKSDDQLPKEPRWIGSDKFDIDAKIADAQAEAMKKLLPDQKFEQYRLMVRSLLMDRFKLAISSQNKELPVLALVVAKSGSRLTPVKGSLDQQAQRMPTLAGGSRGELKGGAVSMAMFTDWLSGRDDMGGRVVIDETGLTGNYDFTMNWTPDEQRNAMSNGNGATQGAASAAALDSPAGSIITALQEQLGLRLESTRAKVDTLVIDHIEKPSEN
jgi:uncharacterized protein (TIGR03435 family)